MANIDGWPARMPNVGKLPARNMPMNGLRLVFCKESGCVFLSGAKVKTRSTPATGLHREPCGKIRWWYFALLNPWGESCKHLIIKRLLTLFEYFILITK